MATLTSFVSISDSASSPSRVNYIPCWSSLLATVSLSSCPRQRPVMSSSSFLPFPSSWFTRKPRTKQQDQDFSSNPISHTMRQSPPAAAAQLSSSRRHLPFTKSSPAGTMTGSHISAPTHTFLTLGPAVNPMMRLAPPPGNRKGSLPLQRPREVVAVAVPPAGPITRSRPEHVVRRNHRGHLLQHSFMSQNAHTPRASQASDAHSRRYSENQLITTRSRFPKHYVSNRASSLNGHETVQIGKSVSGYSLPQMTVWGLEEEEDEFGEDSEGTLDPIEVLESLYQEVPLPPWVNVATADDSYPRQGAASPARGKRSPSPLINSVPPSPERSYSPKNASRSPLSFSMAARLRRNSLVGNGTEKKSRDGDDDE